MLRLSRHFNSYSRRISLEAISRQCKYNCTLSFVHYMSRVIQEKQHRTSTPYRETYQKAASSPSLPDGPHKTPTVIPLFRWKLPEEAPSINRALLALSSTPSLTSRPVKTPLLSDLKRCNLFDINNTLTEISTPKQDRFLSNYAVCIAPNMQNALK